MVVEPDHKALPAGQKTLVDPAFRQVVSVTGRARCASSFKLDFIVDRAQGSVYVRGGPSDSFCKNSTEVKIRTSWFRMPNKVPDK